MGKAGKSSGAVYPGDHFGMINRQLVNCFQQQKKFKGASITEQFGSGGASGAIVAIGGTCAVPYRNLGYAKNISESAATDVESTIGSEFNRNISFSGCCNDFHNLSRGQTAF